MATRKRKPYKKTKTVRRKPRRAASHPHHSKLGGGILLCVLLLVAVAMMISRRVDVPVVDESEDLLDLYEESVSTSTSSTSTSTDATPETMSETKVHFIDIGQGDATLIEQDGEFVLIDAGIASTSEDLLWYLESAGVETISVLVMTHSHADHIGAMDDVINTFDIETVILPDFELMDELPTSATFGRVLTALENSSAKVETAEVGTLYPVGNGLLSIISAGVATDNTNNTSVCTKFVAGDFSMIATGDAEVEVEEEMLARGVNLNATVFKAAHHGSTTSNSMAFLHAMQPEYIVISCGLDNSYGHPHEEVLDNFDMIGANYYRTDLNGNVVLTYTQAEGVTVDCEVEESEAA